MVFDTLKTLLGFWLVGHLTVAGLAFFLHFFSNANHKHKVAISFADYAIVFFKECIAISIHALLFPFGWIPFVTSKRLPTEKSPPVVLVAGLFGNRATLLPVYWRLRKAGFDNIHLLKLSPYLSSLDKIAQNLQPQLDAICRKSNGAPLRIVGFGAGALAIRCLIHQGLQIPILRCIGIGVCYQGTQLAIFAPGQSGTQLRYPSEFLMRLNARNIPLSTLATPLDEFTLPPLQRAFPENNVPSTSTQASEQWLRLEPMGHFHLFYGQPGFRALLNELSTSTKADSCSGNEFQPSFQEHKGPI